MSKITLSESDLGKRGPQIAKMLRPIIGNRNGGALSYSTTPTTNREYKIGVRDKASTLDISDWRFATFHEKFRANYYEIWKPEDIRKQQKWTLSKAYLHIYYIDRVAAKEHEYFALHTDPLEIEGPTAIYKRNPHLHFVVAHDPIPKAHIAITVGSMKDVLASTQTLFSAMKHGIELIRDELMVRY